MSAAYTGTDYLRGCPSRHARAVGQEPVDLAAFFDENRRKFMGAIVILAILNEGTNLTFGGLNTSLLALMVVTWVVLAVTAYLFKSRCVQYVVAAVNVLLTVWYALTFVRTL